MTSLASEVSITQSFEFFGRFGRFGGDMTKLQKLLGDDKLMEAWVKQLDQFPEFRLVHGLFMKPEAQIARVRELNLERGWGLGDACFLEAERSIPKWPEDKLVVVTLVPYLNDDKDGRQGVERTFHELWRVAASQQHTSRLSADFAGPDRLRLLQGIEHKPGLRWEVIDLGRRRGQKPCDVRHPDTSPHAGILASAMLHHEWVKVMDGENVPYVWLPGYEVNVFFNENPWQNVPHVNFDRDSRKINLNDGWYGSCHSRWAVPSLVRE